MIDINIYESQTCKTVSFGRKGENLARRILFDLSALIAEFGAGSFEWVIRRPHESTVYIAINKAQDGNTAILNLTTTETAISGYGGLELRYYVDDVIVKTIVWRTSIAASLGGGDVPDPIEDYIDQMHEIAQDASESADAAGESATQAAVSAANAAGYAAQAAASASASADSATDSAALASAAYTSETNAANSATQASDFAIQAANSASAASGSASQAASSVTQAAGSASAAADSATQAAQSATAADQAAQDIAASSAQIQTNKDDITELKNDLTHVLTITYTESVYPPLTWQNGYIKNADGTIGSSQQDIVSNNFLGDGKVWHVSVANGFKVVKAARYSGLARGTFEEIVLTLGSYTDFNITLTSGKYYSFQVEKDNASNISPSDADENTVIISRREADYIPVWSESVHSSNWCNPADIALNSGKGMQPNGVTRISSKLSYTGFIPVEEGDKVYVLQNSQPSTNGRYRFVTAYNENKEAVEAKGDDTTRRVYTVPEGISYVIVTVFLADYNLGKYSINVGKMYPFDDYYETTLPEGVGNNQKGIDLMQKMPLTSMPDYLVKCLSYRPLTAPTKGYFCLVTDDGHADMVTYTIPMVIAKQIPCTFAVFKESACFSTQEQTAVVVDAVTNHGCAISQHGGRNWTEFSEYGLNQFFDDEKAFFDSLGLSVKSAVIPSHYTSPLISAVAGGRYGVVRSGGQGYDAQGNYGGTVRNYYDYFTSGAGSNLFALSSYNVTTKTLEENKLAVDYAYANNKIMIVYIHENSLTDAKKAVLEGVIDYAKTKGMTFITLDQIPYLNEGTITM